MSAKKAVHFLDSRRCATSCFTSKAQNNIFQKKLKLRDFEDLLSPCSSIVMRMNFRLLGTFFLRNDQQFIFEPSEFLENINNFARTEREKRKINLTSARLPSLHVDTFPGENFPKILRESSSTSTRGRYIFPESGHPPPRPPLLGKSTTPRPVT
ncbi:unnamed protein product, partial [Nesidiocoris tenuis]